MIPERRPYSYRDDPAVPPFPDDRPIIVFDGLCVMCSAWARFVLRHDARGRFRLLPTQTPLGRAIYRHYGLDPENYQTNLLIEGGRVFVKADGSIRMFVGLGAPWAAAAALRIVPLPWLDALYGVVARNRLKWFGTRQVCMLTAPGMADRFLG